MQLVPNQKYISSQSAAEVRLAKLLAAATSDPKAIAYHSFILNKHEYKRMGEIDFVVLWKGAVITIEVKGGRIARHDGLWHFMDRFGKVTAKAEGPWAQARSAMFSLRKRVTESLPDNVRYYQSYMVVTPDSRPTDDTEHETWQWLGPEDMNVQALERKLDGASREARRNPAFPERSKREFFDPDQDGMQKIQRAIRPDFSGAPKLVDHEGRIDEQRLALTDSQVDAMEDLAENARVTVYGGAGTGKTLIAVECARREASRGTSVAFVCLSPGVREMVRMKLAGSDVQVLSLDDVVNSVQKYDLLVIDEAQDLINERDIESLEGILDAGFLDGRWWMFLDPNNQASVDGQFDKNIYEELILANSTRKRLRQNVRNAAPLVSLVRAQLGADLGEAQIDIPGAKPVVIEVPGKAGSDVTILLDEAIVDLIKNQLVDITKIVIITVAEKLDQTSIPFLFENKKAVHRTSVGKIPIFTCKEIKGLESPYVFIVDVDEFSDDESIARTYVAFTRASHYLWAAVSPRAAKQMTQTAMKILREGVVA